MLKFIFLIIFVLSFGGVLFILARKIPALIVLPQNGKTGIKKHQIIKDIESKIREAHFSLFVKQTLLHKTLSFIKIITLKLEAQIDTLLHRIRKKAQEINKQASSKLPK